MPDTPSALVRVSSLKNEINKLVMERARTSLSLSLSLPALGENPVGVGVGCWSGRAVNLSATAAFSATNDSLQEADQR